jgi:two-component system, cell cycle sensor histidine kinase and response regulator CckA
MAAIFFMYGLSFFCLGLVIALYPKKESSYWLAKNIWLVAAFAILHGLNEWVDMLLFAQQTSAMNVARLVRMILLPLSFLFLLQFGAKGMRDLENRYRVLRIAPIVLLALWSLIVATSTQRFLMADIWARYLLAAPGIFLTAAALLLQKNTLAIFRSSKPRFYLTTAILAFILYGFFAGLIVPAAGFFPATFFNYSVFSNTTGVPVQVVRTLCAIVITFSMIKVLEIFNLETKAELITSRDHLDVMVRDRTRALVEMNSDLKREMAEHERAEGLLTHERDKVRKYLDVAGVIILALDADEAVMLINKKGCEIVGYREQEVLGRNWIDMVIPVEKRAEARAGFKELMAGMIDQVESNENAVVSKSGKQRMIAWHNTLLRDEAGTIIGSLSSGEDITERTYAEKSRRESEEKYRDLFENANDAIFMVDADLNYVEVNKKAVELFGYSREELLSMNILDVIPPDQRPKSEIEFKKIRDKESYDKFAGKMRTKDGCWLDIEVSSSPIIKEGKLIGSRDIVRDITDRKRLEEEFLKREKLESLGVLAGGIAHDFNNLLTAILGNISLAKIHADPASKIHSLLIEAEKASLRSSDLSRHLLTFSRGGAPVKAVVNIGALIKETAAFSLSGSDVKCIFQIADDLRVAEIDAGQISQVINNLIINADQAMPEGGTITIVCENVTLEPDNTILLQAGRYVKIDVQDRGTGIRKEHINKIFDPYFTTKQKGSGLGLASAYSIVQRHNGRLTVESTLGSGATFHVYLPAAESDKAEAAAKTETLMTGNGRILVVDDEEIVREVAGEMLKTLGYEVDSARDGNEAIMRYTQARQAGKPFRAVIMDLTMPGGMGGRETMERLREMDPGVKTVVSSGYSHDEVMANFRDFGFIGVISKPYQPSELGKTLHQILAGP